MGVEKPYTNLTNGVKATKKYPHFKVYNPGGFPVRVTELGQMLPGGHRALLSSKDQVAIRAAKAGLVRVLSE